jgi:hypothetical protein
MSFANLTDMVVKMIVARPPFLLKSSAPNESTWYAGGPRFPQSIHR